MSAPSPTIVLVHGAFTDASVWHAVIADLQQGGHRVIAPALSMRSLAADAASLHSVLDSVDGPIVVAGHSYGGSVISDPDALPANVRGLVFVAAFQQDTGETAGELNARFPGSMLTPDTTAAREHPGGTALSLRPEYFAPVYAADVEPATAVVMAAAQHPIDPAALGETFTGPATWTGLPSWALVATRDRSVPAAAQRFMAERAGSTVIEIDSSHAVPVAHPGATADLVAAAARAVSAATNPLAVP
jgi:pimeloyl-ACP methyl ester carboxylesterase